jgi:hypothetical protein
MTQPTDVRELIAKSRSFTEDYAYDINLVRGTMRKLANTTESLLSDIERLREAVDQYRNAPYHSADWLANEIMNIMDVIANDPHPALNRSTDKV